MKKLMLFILLLFVVNIGYSQSYKRLTITQYLKLGSRYLTDTSWADMNDSILLIVATRDTSFYNLAKTYANGRDTALMNVTKAYADTQDSAKLALLNNRDTAMHNLGKAYADSRDSALLPLLMLNADSTRFAKIAMSTPVNAIASVGKMTLADLPHNGDSLIVGTEVWYFKTSPTGAHEILIADSIGTSIRTLVDSITASSTLVTIVGGGTDNVYTWAYFTSKIKGVIGNSYPFLAYGDGVAHFDLSGITLGPGIGGTLGVNGTLGLRGDFRFDSSYLYFCTGENTIADANWRRISLGTAY